MCKMDTKDSGKRGLPTCQAGLRNLISFLKSYNSSSLRGGSYPYRSGETVPQGSEPYCAKDVSLLALVSCDNPMCCSRRFFFFFFFYGFVFFFFFFFYLNINLLCAAPPPHIYLPEPHLDPVMLHELWAPTAVNQNLLAPPISHDLSALHREAQRSSDDIWLYNKLCNENGKVLL
ncbi:hypothetical protein AB205_0149280 [Aquarana catesbeiana]|uniref:Uncharacterized protein n=1 Tax=Aquarana catesbeiana TaxID=8400 RepID=A0A2G9SDD4_AQUCT|nr:hypothetical protein AB205_0149280 [Aquarana catesbeiana]